MKALLVIRLVALMLGGCAGLLSFGAQAYIVPIAGVTHFEETVQYQGLSRTTLYFRPTDTSLTKAPLLIMLHYGGGDAEDMAFLTEVSELVRDYGIWVMLPQAQGNWRDDPSDTSTVDDVGYLTWLIDAAVASYPVDPQRVYMTGFSDGAMMTLRYACQRPDKIAAAGAVAGVMLKTLASQCASPPRATPMLLMNGTADWIVKYSPSRWAISISAPDSAAHWARINGCGAIPLSSTLPDLAPGDGTRVRLDSYLGCSTGNAVEFYTIDNGGHTWPGSPYNPLILGKASMDVSATLAIWEFVKRFSR